MKEKDKPTQIDQGTIDYKSELVRKGIHMFSLSFAIATYYLSTEMMLTIMIPLTALSVIIDFGRHIFEPLDRIFNNLFGFLLRKHELDHKRKNLSGASYVLIGVLITILLFPKPFAVVAIAVLILGDIFAALIGRRFGKTPFLAKSLQGTMAFFVAGSIVVILTPKFSNSICEYVFGFVAVAAGAISENVSYGYLDDNLSIPLSIGFIYWLLFFLFLPHVPIIYNNVPM